MDTEGRCQAEVLDNQSLHLLYIYLRKLISALISSAPEEYPFHHLFVSEMCGNSTHRKQQPRKQYKKKFKRENKIFKLMTYSLPFFCHITRSLSEDFPFLFHKVFPMSCSVLPQFLGHGNNFPWSAVDSPCKAQQGPAWSPTLAQARLSRRT